MLKRVRNYFLTGLLIILPAVLTVALVRFLVLKLNVFLLEPVLRFFPGLQFNPYLEYGAKAATFILVILFIVLIGLATKVIIIRNTFHFFEGLLKKVPMVNKIYSGIKELSNALLGTRAKFFEKVVLLEYPRKGIYSIGFVANQNRGEISRKIKEREVFNVFVPTSPNPTSGVFLIVPKDELTFLEMNSEEALKLIVSVGKVSTKD